MSQIYRCCTFSKYQHSPLAGIPLDLLCSSRKSSPEHKMMFLSTDIVRQTIHNEHWKIMTMGKVKLAHLKKLSKNHTKKHLIFKRGNAQHQRSDLVWREEHKKTISSSGGQCSLLFSFKWLHTYQLTTSRIIKMKFFFKKNPT